MEFDKAAWPHARRAALGDGGHLHARPAARLVGSLRSVASGTRLALAGGGYVADLGEAWKVPVFALLREWGRLGGDSEVLVLASGPDAEQVLELVEDVLGRGGA